MVEGELHLDDTISDITCPSCNSRFSLSGEETATAASLTGKFIAHFECRDVLGEGAFGTVYKAWDSQLERFVAIKVPREGRVNRDSTKSFLREARSAAGIKHPNVVQVFEVGTIDESFYIVSEYIEGISLSLWLRENPLSVIDAAKLMIKICDAVQAAHDSGVIHRDLKPGNILMDASRAPHVTDFGLAKRDDGGEVTVTQHGKVLGTPAYMSPEQASGDTRHIDSVSDVYSLGVIFYQMVSGHRPFEATDSRTLMYRILSEEPRAPRKTVKTIPIDAETICLKAIEKIRQNRYQSAAALRDDLIRFVDGKPIHARPISFAERTLRLIRRNKLSSTAFAAALIFLVATLFQTVSKGTLQETLKNMPAPLVKRVSITYEAQGGQKSAEPDWAVIPLDEATRLPKLEERQVFRKTAKLELDLKPAEYFISIAVPGVGFHEVYRFLPEDTEVSSGQLFNHQAWFTQEDGSVVWPPIVVLPEDKVVASMVLVNGGTFLMGDDSPFLPKHERTVETFFVDPTEVTAGDYTSISQLPFRYEYPRGDYPIVLVSWDSATAYAELVGKRLPREYEFEYLATGLGKFEYPSGSEADYDTEIWTYDAAGVPETDSVKGFPIFGIHSNVAEWTDSLQDLYPGLSADIEFRDPEYARMTNLFRNRVVRGGPVTIGPNNRLDNIPNTTPRKRSSWDIKTQDSEIGFRCVRSQRPHFLD